YRSAHATRGARPSFPFLTRPDQGDTALGDQGELRGRQRDGRTRPVRGPDVECLVSACHARPPRSRLPGGDAQAGSPGRTEKGGGPNALIPLTVPEVRRLLLALDEPPDRFGFRLLWATWRRHHQADAQRC